MITNINQTEKRIVTNEDLYELILNQNTTIVDNKNELLRVISDNKSELLGVISDNKTELLGIISYNKSELLDVMSNQHDMIVDSFDRFFVVMDENNKQLKSEITTELKQEISELRSDMNQRFLSIDKRLLKIEDNMVHKHEFDPLVKRVELLEAVL